MRIDSTYSKIEVDEEGRRNLSYACPKCESDFFIDGDRENTLKLLQTHWENNEYFGYDYKDDVTNIKMLMAMDGDEYTDGQVLDMIEYYLGERCDNGERGAMNRTLQNYEIILPFSFTINPTD